MRNFLEVYKEKSILLYVLSGFWFVGVLGPLWYLLSPIATWYWYWDGYTSYWVIYPNGFTYTTTIYSLASNIFFIVLLILLFIKIRKTVEDKIIRRYSIISFSFGVAITVIFLTITIMAFISPFTYWRVFWSLHDTVKIIGYSLIPLYLGWSIPLMLIPIKNKANSKITAAFIVFSIIPQIGGPLIAIFLNDMQEADIYQTKPTQYKPAPAQTSSYSFPYQVQTTQYSGQPIHQPQQALPQQETTIDREKVMRKIIRMYENIQLDDMAKLLQFSDRIALQHWLMSLPDDLMFTIQGEQVVIPSILKEDSEVSSILLQKLLSHLNLR